MRVAIRVDAGIRIGTGHFMRCLTLADAASRRGAHIRVVSRQLSEIFREMLAARGYEYRAISCTPQAGAAADARETVTALADQTWDWVIVDSYALDARWEQAVHGSAKRLLAIDDLADRAHACDALLDQNFYIDMDARYGGRVSPGCQLLLGPTFALLREEFGSWHERVAPRSGTVRRLVVCFGGQDAANHTAHAIDAAASRGDGLAVDVVIGAAHADREGIQSACAAHGFTCHVQTNRLAELMAAADVGIGAGGGTLWERCSLGLPTLVFPVADNQRRQVHDAARQGWVYAPDQPADDALTPFLERHLDALIENAPLRQAMSEGGMAAVDGRGARRVARYLGGANIELREANEHDVAALFEWRNHPSIREASRSPAPLDWASHQQWFASLLSDRNRVLLIGQNDSLPVGVVRFDIQGDEAEVSIYLVPGGADRGTGTQLLGLAESWLQSSRPDVRRCRAHVLGTNVQSHRLFTGSGYELESSWYFKRLGA